MKPARTPLRSRTPGRPKALPTRRDRLRRALVPAALVAVALAFVLAVTLVAGWQALRTDAGTAWVLSKVPGLKVSAGRGQLRGGPFSAAQVELALEGSALKLRID